MSVLSIPEAGLQLEGSASSSDFLPMQAFGITLNDSVIEDMIKCVQKGQEIDLTLGSNPTFQYGSKEQKVTAPASALDYELYLTNLDESATKAQRLPNPTTSILRKPPTAAAAGQAKRADITHRKQASRASSSGADSDDDAVASSYARADAQKSSNAAKIVNGIPKDAKRGGKGKLLPPSGRSAMSTVYSSTTTRSLPSSPALNGVASPNPAFSASQQLLEKNKGQRSILVHELAVRDQTFDHLKDVWLGADSELKPTVDKVASFDPASQKYSLKKIYWKELDVWNYDYDSAEDRKTAIENAVKKYDNQRLGTSDPVWERLLPREERGKGIVLSKLQATLAKGNITPAPKISVQKPEDGNKSDMDSKTKGEPMARSNSQPVSNKPKKVSEREAQTKRLLSSNPKKPAPKKPASKAKASEERGKKILSEEFVYDTSSEDEAPLSQSTVASTATAAPKPKPVERPSERLSEKASEKPKVSPAPSPLPKAKPKSVVRAPRAPAKAPPSSSTAAPKRRRDDDDSSSSSGAPLSKRIKPPKEAPRPMSDARMAKHRASDASQNSRGTTGTTSSNYSMKSKNTSPAKSSPLASSPPTNASDFEESQSSQHPPNHSQQHPTQTQTQRNSTRDRERERERDRGHTAGMVNGMSTSSSTSSVSSVARATQKRKEREMDAVSQQSTPMGSSNKKARVSKDVLMQARMFTLYYEQYESLHHEIAAHKEPPEDKLEDLLEMRKRLVDMKSNISRAVASGA
ncbi:hypothetical protein F4780DRAFT_767179 [Xylariomycetidae sp. FL0641]|nr:hypothetical protein F4780DRAFT_767179 [Xylariomycetidae sp. FL0641]